MRASRESASQGKRKPLRQNKIDSIQFNSTRSVELSKLEQLSEQERVVGDEVGKREQKKEGRLPWVLIGHLIGH